MGYFLCQGDGETLVYLLGFGYLEDYISFVCRLDENSSVGCVSNSRWTNKLGQILRTMAVLRPNWFVPWEDVSYGLWDSNLVSFQVMLCRLDTCRLVTCRSDWNRLSIKGPKQCRLQPFGSYMSTNRPNWRSTGRLRDTWISSRDTGNGSASVEKCHRRKTKNFLTWVLWIRFCLLESNMPGFGDNRNPYLVWKMKLDWIR